MRPGFMIYHDDLDSYSHLSDRDMGRLIRLLYKVSLGETPDVPRSLLSEFNSMAKRVQKDAEAYEKKVEQATRASRSRKNKTSDDNGRYRTISDDIQHNITQHNITQLNNKRNPTLNYDQRTDDLNEVLADL